MTFSNAFLKDEVVLGYLSLIAGLLALAGLALALLEKVFKKDVVAIRTTYRSWLVMVPLGFATLFLGRDATILALGLLACGAFKEFARATGLYHDWWMSGGVYAGILAVAALSWVSDPGTGQPGWYGMFMALPVYVVGLLLILPILRGRARHQLQLISLSILGFIYFGWMFGHLGFLANSVHFTGYLLYLVFAVEVGDIAAFTFGKLFGRRKLRPEISPNKTLEGALGAFAVALALPWLLAFSLPHFGPWQRLLCGLITGLGGQFGDLALSLIKRDLGIKDMGAVIPGHGGILDRIDSLIFTAPLFFHMVRYFYDLY